MYWAGAYAFQEEDCWVLHDEVSVESLDLIVPRAWQGVDGAAGGSWSEG